MVNLRTRSAARLLLLCLSLSPNIVSADQIPAQCAASSEYSSSWCDFAEPQSFDKGTQLALQVDGEAKRVLVRVLRSGQNPNDKAGIVGSVVDVPESGPITVTLPRSYTDVSQISVHGGPKPWNHDLGADNGAPTLVSIDRIEQ